MNIINIAHGAFIMLGAYATYWLFAGLGLDPFFGLPLAMAAVFLLGWLLQKYLINFVVQADIFITLLLTFGIGTVLAAAAGGLWAILFPLSPSMGGILTLKSFVVTIIGGLRTMLGSLIGGLILGVVEALGTNLFGSTYENLISFSIFLLVLIFMPKGILGGRGSV